jgi:hypothetical protein
MRRKPRATLADLYAEIPVVPCRGLCVDSCGPISMSRAEADRVRAHGIEIPPMTDALEAIERGEDYYCPALRDGRCGVYEDRPTICRLWGATESMPCPHGCTPERPLTQAESHDVLRRSAVAGGGMVDDLID